MGPKEQGGSGFHPLKWGTQRTRSRSGVGETAHPGMRGAKPPVRAEENGLRAPRWSGQRGSAAAWPPFWVSQPPCPPGPSTSQAPAPVFLSGGPGSPGGGLSLPAQPCPPAVELTTLLAAAADGAALPPLRLQSSHSLTTN